MHALTSEATWQLMDLCSSGIVKMAIYYAIQSHLQ